MSFQMKPLEIADFSGGMTDTYITAGPTHYQYADNFWITIDKNLQQRYGTDVIDSVSYNLGGLVQKTNGLFTMVNDSLLLAQGNRTLYNFVPQSSFKAILGPTGNETMGAGDANSYILASEWRRQLYLTSSAQPVPSKVYRDHTNTFQARTVGLPRVTGPVNLTSDQILYKAINLANDILQSMIAHIQDLSLHAKLDKVALNYFIAQTFLPTDEQPPAGVVQAPAATNQASLFLLIGNLNAAYEHERADASLNGSRVYHTNMKSYAGNGAFLSPTGMHVRVVNSATPITLNIAAASIDDLAQKWYWHRLGVWIHSPINDYNAMNLYAVTNPKVGTISTGLPIVTGNFTDAFNFVNNCKFLYNTHLTDAGNLTPLNGYSRFMHKFVDALITQEPWTVSLPDCTDYDSYANLIFWMRALYAQHYNDMVSQYFYVVTFNTTGSTNTVASFIYKNAPAALAVPQSDIFPPAENLYVPGFGNLNGPNYPGGAGQYADTWAVGGVGTGTLRRYGWNNTITGQLGQVSKSQYHVAKDATGNLIDAKTNSSYNIAGTTAAFQPSVSSLITSQIDSVGADAKGWLAYAAEFFYALMAHSIDATAHANIHVIGAPSFSGAPQNSLGTYSVPNTPFFVPTIASYAYAFIYTSTYTVEPNGIQYLVQSNPVFVGPIQSSTVIPVGATIVSQFVNVYPNVTYKTTQPLAITSIPALVNTVNTNYDTSFPASVGNPSLIDAASTTGSTTDIYRTTDGGVTYYKEISLNVSTTSYSDSFADSASASTNIPQLNLQQVLYTSGGVVGNDQPPQAISITQLNGFMYYGNIIDTGQTFPNRVRQSLQNNPDSAPATFFDDLDDAIVGLAATRSVVVAICSKSIYRLTGQFNSLGQGAMTHEKISDKIGGLSAKSIVSTEIGIFFAGTDGFYYTDGYQLIKISIDLNARYAGLTQNATQQTRLQGAYDRYNRRIYWTVQQDPTDTNCDSFWVFYLDYGVKPSGVFTTMSNTTFMRPSSVAAFNGNLVYGHELGYVLKTDPLIKTDPVINTAAVPSLWQEQYMPYYYASSALTMGSVFTRKYSTKIHFLGNNVGNASMQYVSINDNNAGILFNLPTMQYRANPIWGQPNIIWNQPQAQQPYSWEYDGIPDFWRRFPAGSMRYDVKQMILQPAFAANYRSEDWPPFCFASINSGTKVITIATPTGFTAITWPLDIVGMQFSFSTDNYLAAYTVVSVSGANATVSDPGSKLVTLNTLGWVIRGYQKNQRVNISNMIIYYDYLGDKTSQYLGPQSSGENI